VASTDVKAETPETKDTTPEEQPEQKDDEASEKPADEISGNLEISLSQEPGPSETNAVEEKEETAADAAL